MPDGQTDKKLVVVWSSADREVALSNVFMYTKNARIRDWWPRVRLVVWGPSAKLLCEDAELQEEMALLKDAGVELLACKACADRFGKSEQLEAMGINVIYMGMPLTEMLQNGWTCLTY